MAAVLLLLPLWTAVLLSCSDGGEQAATSSFHAENEAAARMQPAQQGPPVPPRITAKTSEHAADSAARAASVRSLAALPALTSVGSWWPNDDAELGALAALTQLRGLNVILSDSECTVASVLKFAAATQHLQYMHMQLPHGGCKRSRSCARGDARCAVRLWRVAAETVIDVCWAAAACGAAGSAGRGSRSRPQCASVRGAAVAWLMRGSLLAVGVLCAMMACCVTMVVTVTNRCVDAV